LDITGNIVNFSEGSFNIDASILQEYKRTNNQNYEELFLQNLADTIDNGLLDKLRKDRYSSGQSNKDNPILIPSPTFVYSNCNYVDLTVVEDVVKLFKELSDLTINSNYKDNSFIVDKDSNKSTYYYDFVSKYPIVYTEWIYITKPIKLVSITNSAYIDLINNLNETTLVDFTLYHIIDSNLSIDVLNQSIGLFNLHNRTSANVYLKHINCSFLEEDRLFTNQIIDYKEFEDTNSSQELLDYSLIDTLEFTECNFLFINSYSTFYINTYAQRILFCDSFFLCKGNYNRIGNRSKNIQFNCLYRNRFKGISFSKKEGLDIEDTTITLTIKSKLNFLSLSGIYLDKLNYSYQVINSITLINLKLYSYEVFKDIKEIEILSIFYSPPQDISFYDLMRRLFPNKIVINFFYISTYKKDLIELPLLPNTIRANNISIENTKNILFSKSIITSYKASVEESLSLRIYRDTDYSNLFNFIYDHEKPNRRIVFNILDYGVFGLLYLYNKQFEDSELCIANRDFISTCLNIKDKWNSFDPFINRNQKFLTRYIRLSVNNYFVLLLNESSDDWLFHKALDKSAVRCLSKWDNKESLEWGVNRIHYYQGLYTIHLRRDEGVFTFNRALDIENLRFLLLKCDSTFKPHIIHVPPFNDCVEAMDWVNYSSLNTNAVEFISES